jgi:outer membrane protein OmpA-like peptidoglycan-associated protein
VKEDDILSVLKFATEPLLEVKPTSDHNEFIKNFKMDGKTLGGTDILRALDSAGKILSAIPEEYTRIILLFTDGVSSMVSYRRVIGGLYKNKIRVFGICYGMVNFEPIKKISQDTDGQLLLLRNVKDFAAAFQHIYNTLTNYYEVTYYPPSCYNLHNFQLNISLAELEYEHLKINGDYDVSILSNFAEEGTKVMSDISFEYGKSVISDSGLVKIVDIAEQLKRNSAVKILVIGHTDDIGGDEYNMKLSKDRAESVKKELIRLGIPANRLQATGKGKNDPLVPNDSNENRKQNRRTEFVVVE